MSDFSGVFQVFEQLFEARYRRRYDGRLQLMAYQIEMLQSRIDTDRIYTRPEERARLTRIGAELDHDVDDVLLVVKRGTYRETGLDRKKMPGRKSLAVRERRR
ncbi:MAG: hypothetical protein WC047_03355 [Kiritimatiellales bacterium]